MTAIGHLKHTSTSVNGGAFSAVADAVPAIADQRAALYLRVSTREQTVDNQDHTLRQ
jgi:hypothetical protein